MPPSPPLRSTSPSSPAYSDDEPMSSPPSSTTTPTTKPSSTSRGARRSSSDKENDNMMSRSSRNRGGINPDGSSDDSEQAKLDKLTGQDIFDPNQDRNERRKILGEYRQIGKEFEESRGEIIKSTNGIDRLTSMVDRMNSTYTRVKQTSDATVDSALLLRLSDLARRKVASTQLGSSGAVNIDIDEFVTRCIGFMKNTPNRPLHGLAWGEFARKVAFPASRRPALPHHLLGPLSVEKKIRVQKVQRSAGMRKSNPAKAVKPTEMSLDEGENNHQTSALNRVTGVFKVLWDYWLSKTDEEREEGLNYFECVVNPNSFSQTIENIFYVAFLVKNGNVELFEEDCECDSEDEESEEEEDEEGNRRKKKKRSRQGGMLRIWVYSDEEAKENKPDEGKGAGRSQMLMSLNMWEWRQIVEVFGLRGREPVIPNREVEDQTVAAGGWFK